MSPEPQDSPTGNRKESSTDQINFSFESLVSDLNTTLNATINERILHTTLNKSLFTESINANQPPQPDQAPQIDVMKDEIDEVLNFSFPSTDAQRNVYVERHSKVFTKKLNESKTEIITKERTSETHKNLSLNADESIEISDDEFEYSIHLSKPGSPDKQKDELQDEESIEISDDEINYSMSHESDALMPSRRTIDRLRKDDEHSTLNESLQQIFDENFDPPAEMHIRINDPEPEEDVELTNQSVRSIVRKDFVANTKPKPFGGSSSKSGTSFRRFASEVLSTNSSQSKNKSYSRNDFCNDFDSFDDLLQGMVVPASTDTKITSTPVEGDDQEFTVVHAGSTFEVKIGQRCVTPKPNFDQMDSPTMAIHLKKYGLKPLVRRKAIICLEHIYNRMHPFVECLDEDALKRTDFDVEPVGRESNTVDLAQGEDDHNTSTESVEINTMQLFTSKNATLNSLPVDFFVYFLNEQTDYFMPSQPRAKVNE